MDRQKNKVQIELEFEVDNEVVIITEERNLPLKDFIEYLLSKLPEYMDKM